MTLALAMHQKRKSTKWDNKLTSFCTAKDTGNKKPAYKTEEVSENHVLSLTTIYKGSYPKYIWNSLNLKTKNLVKKWAEELTRHFPRGHQGDQQADENIPNRINRKKMHIRTMHSRLAE